MEAEDKQAHTIYLVTCGEGKGDCNNLFAFPEDDYLSETGKLQAELLGKFLSKTNVTRIFYSDYPKAIQTVQAIHKERHWSFCAEEVKVVPMLRERVFGALYGKTKYDVLKPLTESGGDLMTYEHEGCENLTLLGYRIHYFFRNLLEKMDRTYLDEEVVVVVSHPYILTTLVNKIVECGLYIDSGWKPSYGNVLQQNASFIKMSVSNPLVPDYLLAPREVQFLSAPQANYFRSLTDPKTHQGCKHRTFLDKLDAKMASKCFDW